MSRMKVLTVVIFCTIIGASIGLAQGLYLTANAGYGFGAGTQNFGQSETVRGVNDATREGVYGSLGEGFKFGASAGYMFNKNLGAELGFSYWFGKSIEIEDKLPGWMDLVKLAGSGFVAIPSIVVSADMNMINPYARLGLVIGFLKVKEDRRIEETTTYEYRWEETGNLAFGYAGALGIVVPVGGMVGFFAEIALHSVTYSPSQIEITKLTENGVDRLSTQQNRVTKYKESFTLPTTENTLMAVRRPFGSIGMAIGVKIDL